MGFPFEVIDACPYFIYVICCNGDCEVQVCVRLRNVEDAVPYGNVY